MGGSVRKGAVHRTAYRILPAHCTARRRTGNTGLPAAEGRVEPWRAALRQVRKQAAAWGWARAAQWAGPQAAGQLPGMVYKMWRPPRKMRFGMLCGWKTAWPKPPERRRETDQARARPHKRWRPAAAPFRAGGTRHDTNHTGAAHWCRSFRWNQETQEYVPIPTDMRSLNWRFLANRIHKRRRGKG